MLMPGYIPRISQLMKRTALEKKYAGWKHYEQGDPI
jgi:hypothetical protein